MLSHKFEKINFIVYIDLLDSRDEVLVCYQGFRPFGSGVVSKLWEGG